MDINLMDRFTENIISLNNQTLPKRLEADVRMHFLDYLGVTLAGAKMQKSKIEALLANMPEGKYKVIGCGCKTDFFSSAFTNGINSHFIELDDGHRKGMLHLEAPIYSALLTLSQIEDFCWEDFIRGVVMGYEVAIRIAMSVQPKHKLKGYHATGTCGTIGVATAVATALHFDAVQMKDSLSAAMTSAAGLLEMIDDDSELKPYNVGRCVVDGLIAAFSGRAGFHAPNDALGGKRGFLAVATDNPNTDVLVNFDTEHFMIEGAYMKPYAACRHLHPAIEGALKIKDKEQLDWRKIKSVVVDAYHLAVFGHDHQVVTGVNSAKMSIPYSVAVALVNGSANIRDYSTEAVADADVLSLAQKVEVRDNEELTKLCPEKRASIVTVILDDGSEITERVDYPKGEPENPMSQVELEEKFKSLAIYGGLTSNECEDVTTEILRDVISVSKILNIVCKK